MIIESFGAATPSVFAAYFDLCLPERIYLAQYCRAFPSPAIYMLLRCLRAAQESAQPRLFQSFSSILCANSHAHMRPDRLAQACRVIEMVGRLLDAPVKCDLDRVCVDRTAASGRPPAECRFSDRICETRSAPNEPNVVWKPLLRAMHKVSKVWETHITPKKEQDQILEVESKCQRVVPLISTTTAFGAFSCSNHSFSSPFHSWPKEVQSIFLMFSEVVARAKKELCGSRMSSRQVTTPSSTKKMIPTQT